MNRPDWSGAVSQYVRDSRPIVVRMSDGVTPPDREEDFGEPYRGIPRARRVVPWFAWLALGVGLGVAAVVSGGAL